MMMMDGREREREHTDFARVKVKHVLESLKVLRNPYHKFLSKDLGVCER